MFRDTCVAHLWKCTWGFVWCECWVATAAQSIMSRVQIDNITIVNPKAAPCDPIRLAVTFSALVPLPRVLTWKVIYVGSAFSEDYDQVLEEFQIGPIPQASTMSFTADCEAPDLTKLPAEQVLATTALIISISYDQQEFTRIGYYVLNATTYDPEEAGPLPLQEMLAHVDRIIITEKPRVTKFEIKWEESQESSVKEKQKEEKVEQKVQKENAVNAAQVQPLDKKESQQRELKLQGEGQRSTEHPSTPQFGEVDDSQ